MTLEDESVEESSNTSSIEEVSAKVTLRGNYSSQVAGEFGIEGNLRRIIPRDIETTFNDQSAFRPVENSQDLALFAAGNIKLGRDFAIEAGLRLQTYLLPGDDGNISFLEPRLNLSYAPTNAITMNASYTRMTQGLHMISNNFIGLPTNLWVTANRRVPPSVGNQFSLGVSRVITGNTIALDTYYKTARNIIDPLPGVSFFQTNTENWEDDVSSGGENRIYGVEASFRRSGKRLFGWLAYNLSWNRIRYDDINRGEWYFRQFDRRHDLSLVAGYRLKKRWQVIGNFVLNSGYRLTLPVAIGYDGLTNSVLPIFDGRYNATTPLYHRMDVTFRKTKVNAKGNKRVLSLGCYNVYGRQNTTFVTSQGEANFDLDPSPLRSIPAFIDNDIRQFSLFTFIPFINYEFTF